MLFRIAAASIAGAVLYYAGIVNSIVIYEPSRGGAAVVVAAVGAALVLLGLALRGTARPDTGASSDPTSRRLMRGAWLVICAMALVSLAWIWTAPRQRAFDWTPYHNDAIVLNECASQLVLTGRQPYRDLDLFACYRERGIGPDRTTPLQQGLFSGVTVYPSDDELDAAWALRARGEGENLEFVERVSYPALSFVAIAPWVAAGWDTNILYLLCLFAAGALVLVRAAPPQRPWLLTGLLGATSTVAFTIGGSSDLLYALPLVAAWLWRERGWSAFAYGVAAATKQIAWFFAPFLFLQWMHALGLREALRRAAVATATFFVFNAPWLVSDPGGWVAGVLTPVAEPMFPRGAGLVFLGTNGVGPLLPNLVYAVAEAAAFVACLVVAWRERERSPELGVLLAAVPLYFAHRSLFSYFFLLPLFALAGLARLPVRSLAIEQARRAGALTIFALPAPRER